MPIASVADLIQRRAAGARPEGFPTCRICREDRGVRRRIVGLDCGSYSKPAQRGGQLLFGADWDFGEGVRPGNFHPALTAK